MANFVLIPGAWLGAWAWKKIVPLLNQKGHGAFPVTLTGMGDRVHLASDGYGMETAVMDVLNFIDYNEIEDPVIVGHSFAGKVASAVADRIPEKTKMVMYLDAAIPERTREPQQSFDPTEEFGPVPEGGTGIPFSEDVLEAIGQDVVGEDRKWMLSMCTEWPVKLAKDPITLSEKLDSIPASYILCSLSTPVERFISGEWGTLYGPYRVMETAHYPMITKPEELVKNMIELLE